MQTNIFLAGTSPYQPSSTKDLIGPKRMKASNNARLALTQLHSDLVTLLENGNFPLVGNGGGEAGGVTCFQTKRDWEVASRGVDCLPILFSRSFQKPDPFPQGFWWFSGKDPDPWKEWKWKLPLEPLKPWSASLRRIPSPSAFWGCHDFRGRPPALDRNPRDRNPRTKSLGYAQKAGGWGASQN